MTRLARLVSARPGAAALALILLVTGLLWQNQRVQKLNVFDQPFYLGIAYDLVHHGRFSDGYMFAEPGPDGMRPPGMRFSPLWPGLVAAAAQLDGRLRAGMDCVVGSAGRDDTCPSAAPSLRLLQFAELAGFFWLVWWLGNAASGAAVGWLGLALALVTSPLLLRSVDYLMTEMTCLFLSTAATAAGVRALEAAGHGRPGVGGPACLSMAGSAYLNAAGQASPCTAASARPDTAELPPPDRMEQVSPGTTELTRPGTTALAPLEITQLARPDAMELARSDPPKQAGLGAGELLRPGTTEATRPGMKIQAGSSVTRSAPLDAKLPPRLGTASRSCLGWACASGALLGLTALTRPAFLYLVPTTLLALALAARGRAVLPGAAFLAGAVTVLAPWVARNAAVLGRAALTYGYDSHTLVQRIAFDTMTWREYAHAYLCWLPDGTALGRDFLGPHGCDRFAWDNQPSSFYVLGLRHMLPETLAAAGGYGHHLRYLLTHYIFRMPVWHVLVSIPLALRGAYVAHWWGFILLPVTLACTVLALRRAWHGDSSAAVFLVMALPAWFMLALNAGVAVNQVRYNLLLITPYAVAGGLGLHALWRRAGWRVRPNGMAAP